MSRASGLVIGIDADTERLACAAMVRGAFRSVETVERANARNRVHAGYTSALRDFMLRVQHGGGMIFLEDIFLKSHRSEDSATCKRNVTAFKALAIVQGEICHEARRADVLVEIVAANTWRAQVLGVSGPREVCKFRAAERASQICGREGLSIHEQEAICIAAYGSQAIGVADAAGWSAAS